MDNASSMYLYVGLIWDTDCFFPVESEDCRNSSCINAERCRQEEGHILYPSLIEKSQQQIFIVKKVSS